MGGHLAVGRDSGGVAKAGAVSGNKAIFASTAARETSGTAAFNTSATTARPAIPRHQAAAGRSLTEQAASSTSQPAGERPQLEGAVGLPGSRAQGVGGGGESASAAVVDPGFMGSGLALWSSLLRYALHDPVMAGEVAKDFTSLHRMRVGGDSVSRTQQLLANAAKTSLFKIVQQRQIIGGQPMRRRVGGTTETIFGP